MTVFLTMNFAFAADNQLQLLGQGVHHRYPYPVQTAGYFIGVIVELTARMQHGHDDFSSGHTLFFVDARRNTTAVILHRYRVIRMNSNDNIFTIACERFVDSVVHHLEYHVMQTGSVIRITDIHPRAFTDRIQPF